MSLSKREKVMLFILGIIILVAAFYMIILKPQLNRIDELNNQVQALQMQVDATNKNISLESQVLANYKKLNEKINAITMEYFPSIDQEKIIVILDEFIKSSKVETKSLSFEEINISTIDESKTANKDKGELSELYSIIQEYMRQDKTFENVSKNDSKSINSNETNISLVNMSSTMFFQGKYDEIVNLLGEIESFDKKIIINNLNLVKQDEEDIIAGSIILQFYAVPRLKLEDDEYYQWDYEDVYGKENPFYDEDGSNKKQNISIINQKEDDNTTQDGESSEKQTSYEYDFGMWVKSITSDNTTVGMGKYDDAIRTSYVYGDNVGVEPVDISLQQQGENYYVRYSTTSESYPKNKDELVQFKPKGKAISLKIFSSLRVSNNDISGVSITIDNKTDREFIVDIINDDTNRPRVNIVTQDGNITINRYKLGW